MDVSFTGDAKNSPRLYSTHYSDASGLAVVTRRIAEVLRKSCAATRIMFLSRDALGFLVDLCRTRRAASAAGTFEVAEIDGSAANRPARAACVIRIDHRVSVVGSSGSRVAGVGPRIEPRRVGSCDSRALADRNGSNCRRRDFGEFAMVQFAPRRPDSRKVAGVYESARGADPASIAGGAACLSGIGYHRRGLRGVLVPGFRDGGFGSGWACRLGGGASFLRSFWFSTPLPGARWAVEHTGHWHSVRNGANRVRWDCSRNALAFCGGRRGRSRGPQVSIQAGTSEGGGDFHKIVSI